MNRPAFVLPTTMGDPGRRLDSLEASLGEHLASLSNAFDVGGLWSLVSVSKSYVARPWDIVLCDPTSAPFMVGIPDPSKSVGAWIAVKNDSASSNTITLSRQVRTIDGATMLVLAAPRVCVVIVSNGLEWKVLQQTGDTGIRIQDGADADTTALANRLLRMPATTALRTVKLPASPSDGTWCRVKVTNAADFFITVDGNGKNINDGFQLSTSTYVMANEGTCNEFVYSATQGEWILDLGRTPVVSRRMRYHAADANTVALWQGFGNKNDSGSGGLTLTLGAGTERYGDMGDGLSGFALDGSTYYKRASNDAALNLAGDMTIECIVRPLVQPAGLNAGIIAGYGAPGETGNNDNVFWQAGLGNATVGGAANMSNVVSSSFFYEHDAGVNVQVDAPFLRPLHHTHHLAWVRTGTTLIPYVNGFALPSFTGLTLGAVGGAPTQFVTIGADKDVANFVTALVASVKISNVARSAGYILKDAIRCLGIGPGIVDTSTGAV